MIWDILNSRFSKLPIPHAYKNDYVVTNKRYERKRWNLITAEIHKTSLSCPSVLAIVYLEILGSASQSKLFQKKNGYWLSFDKMATTQDFDIFVIVSVF